ncbi:hypothetical protein KC19_1G273500 [Ceratodon purpureus]|uniref:Uncharacterized protein n=1 Tax=Ceratodon purpureus TaxID=3225 RepID=A0A8T0JCE7_CERPU|nr:hypothetical protein KC19_1G273500 [Ceratodon purpureus]
MACPCRFGVVTAIASTTPLGVSLGALRIPAVAISPSFFTSNDGRFRGEGFRSMGLDHRTSPCVAAMAPRATRGSTRQSVWSGGVGRGKGRRLAGPVRAMGDETMWITATSAVALVVALAAFAALGGYLLSMGVDNEERSEVRNFHGALCWILQLCEKLFGGVLLLFKFLLLTGC